MRPKRHPYSGKLKASTVDIVKAWEKAYSAYRVKGQKNGLPISSTSRIFGYMNILKTW